MYCSFYFDWTAISALVGVLVSSIVLIHITLYFLDPFGIRQYPGPFLAKFSDAWLGWVSKNGHRSEVVHEMHLKYGMLRAHAFQR